MPCYKPREKNVIQENLQDHFNSFVKNYDTQYSEKYGKYWIIYIKETVERFVECGDYSKGVARIKCTITTYGHEYSRPFIASLKVACKSWYLCPSCEPQDVREPANQKRLLLFSEHLSENVLLKLPHRQFVFTLPKLLRVYFKYDRKPRLSASQITWRRFKDHIFHHTRLLHRSGKNDSKDRSHCFLSVVRRPDEMESVQFLLGRNCQGVCLRQTPPLPL